MERGGRRREANAGAGKGARISSLTLTFPLRRSVGDAGVEVPIFSSSSAPN
jgi:hypothetical protein